MNKPIQAIYREREDGDFEFVCAHNCEELDQLAYLATGRRDAETTAQFVQSLCGFLGQHGHGQNFKVVGFDEPNQMPSVLSEASQADGPVLIGSNFDLEDEAELLRIERDHNT